jgi:acetyl-CoA carboxylase biotin carboxyl carrier protein
VGDAVSAGQPVAILESMKMQIPVLAEHGGEVQEIGVAEGDVVQEGDLLVALG